MSLQLDQRQRAMLAEMGVHLPAAAVIAPEQPMPNAPVDTAPERAVLPRHTGTAEAGESMAGSRSTSREATPAQGQRSAQPATHERLATPITRPVHAVPSLASRPITGTVADLSWSALQDAVAGCEACTLCQQRRNTVFGTGAPEPALGEAPQVDWMIVGEAPGEHEDLQGEPFVGQAAAPAHHRGHGAVCRAVAAA